MPAGPCLKNAYRRERQCSRYTRKTTGLRPSPDATPTCRAADKTPKCPDTTADHRSPTAKQHTAHNIPTSSSSLEGDANPQATNPPL